MLVRLTLFFLSPMNLVSILSKYLPKSTINYCVALWNEYPFSFKVTRSRESKLGDYRFDRSTGSHIITINHDLNPYAFLITYLHEVAHRIVKEKYNNISAPHGSEWKHEFQQLLTHSLSLNCYPDELLPALLPYIANPKASSAADHKLYLSLRKYDDKQVTTLADINTGEQFIFKGKVYTKGKLQRTRCICIEMTTNRKYLIPQIAEVHLKRD